MFHQQLALCIASGTNFLNYKVMQGNVLHIDFEQGERLTNERYQRLANALGIDQNKVKLWTVCFPDVNIAKPSGIKQIELMVDIVKPLHTVIDSLGACCQGIDENSSAIRNPIDALGKIFKDRNSSCQIIHHARKPSNGEKSGGKYSLRGSGGIFAAVDSCFIFTGEKNQPTYVTHEKDRTQGTLLEEFGLDTIDVHGETGHRWGVKMNLLNKQQVNDRQEAADDKLRDQSVHNHKRKIIEYLRKMPEGKFPGNVSELFNVVSGFRNAFFAAVKEMDGKELYLDKNCPQGRIVYYIQLMSMRPDTPPSSNDSGAF
jgi:hypothetical protein